MQRSPAISNPMLYQCWPISRCPRTESLWKDLGAAGRSLHKPMLALKVLEVRGRLSYWRDGRTAQLVAIQFCTCILWRSLESNRWTAKLNHVENDVYIHLPECFESKSDPLPGFCLNWQRTKKGVFGIITNRCTFQTTMWSFKSHRESLFPPFLCPEDVAKCSHRLINLIAVDLRYHIVIR